MPAATLTRGSGTCDVLVVGAGPAGATTALALARRGFCVWLVDRGGARAASLGESLVGAAQLVLRELGLWQRFVAGTHRRTYLTESAWQGETLEERHAIASPFGPDFHVDRPSFDAFLVRAAEGAGVRFLGESRVEKLVRDDARGGFLVELRTPEQSERLAARYVVDATGRSAWVGRRLEATRHAADRLIGVARWFDVPGMKPSILVESTPKGWWYSAPTPGERALALWVTDATDPAAHATRADIWDECLGGSQHTRARFEQASAIGEARAFAAAPTSTSWDLRGDWLPVGDAAVAFDPISGSGLMFALRSALDAAQVLDDARRGRPETFGDYRRGVLAAYQQHLHRRAELYAAVRRWPESQFWSKNRGSAVNHREHA